MVCSDYREIFSAYIDEVLNDQEKQELEAHLKSCPTCRQELAELEYTVSLVRNLGEVSAPVGLVPTVIERLERENKKSINWKAWGLGKIASVAGILLVVAGIGIASLGGGEVGLHSYADSAKSAEMAQADIAMNQSVANEESMKRAGQSSIAEQNTMSMADGAVPEAAQSKAKTLANAVAKERKVIKRASLNLEVPDVNATYNKLIQEAEKLGGFVESSSLNNETLPDGRIVPSSGTMVLRVPSSSFAGLLNFSEGAGKVLFKEMSGQDVSTEFYDTETRIENYKQQEARLREILTQAKNVDEILKVETQLQRVRSEVEVMEGRIRELSNLTDLGTLTVSLVKTQTGGKIETLAAGSLVERTRDAFIVSVNELLKDLGDLVVGTGRIMPQLLVAVVIAAIGYLGYRVTRKG